jgi:hypothetical protein
MTLTTFKYGRVVQFRGRRHMKTGGTAGCMAAPAPRRPAERDRLWRATVDGAALLNVLAVVISFLALAVSGLLASRQASMMRHANEMPILVELMQEFQSKSFQEAEDYVINSLSVEADPAAGWAGLPTRARLAVNTVASFFGSLGSIRSAVATSRISSAGSGTTGRRATGTTRRSDEYGGRDGGSRPPSPCPADALARPAPRPAGLRSHRPHPPAAARPRTAFRGAHFSSSTLAATGVGPHPADRQRPPAAPRGAQSPAATCERARGRARWLRRHPQSPTPPHP